MDRNKKFTCEDVERLLDIKDEMKELLHEAASLIRGTNQERFSESYWIAHIKMALDKDHGYLTSGHDTMQATIEALEAQLDEQEEIDEIDSNIGGEK